MSEFFFSDYAYIEIVFDADPNPNAIRLGVDPYVLMRPEGRWDRPGHPRPFGAAVGQVAAQIRQQQARNES